MRFIKVNSTKANTDTVKTDKNCGLSSVNAAENHNLKENVNTMPGIKTLSEFPKNLNKCKLYRRFFGKHFVKDAISSIFKRFDSPDKRKVAPFAGAFFAFVLVILFNMCFSFGYNVFLQGADMGCVPDKEYATLCIDEINTEFAEYVSGENIISGTVSYAPVIIRKNAFTDKDTFKENIKATSYAMTKAYSVKINGKVFVAFETREDADSVIASVLGSYKTDENTSVSFGEKVEVVNQYVPSVLLFSADSAAERIDTHTTVLSSDTVSYEETVPFEEEVTQDSTMYEGSEKVLRAGTNGTTVITEVIERRDGEIVNREVVEAVVAKEPTMQLRAVGTKERPNYVGTGSFIRPYYGQISSRFGSRRSGTHTGVDFCGRAGDPISAADSGRVIFAGWSGGYGNVVKIDHNNGYVTYYAHCQNLYVSEGDVVKKGQTIASVGSTGNSTGPHLHFEVRYNDEVQNPMNYVD